jgi:hypothetical protein
LFDGAEADRRRRDHRAHAPAEADDASAVALFARALDTLGEAQRPVL